MNLLDRLFTVERIKSSARKVAKYMSDKNSDWYTKIYTDDKIRVITEYTSQATIRVYIKDKDGRKFIEVFNHDYLGEGLVRYNKGMWVKYLLGLKDKAEAGKKLKKIEAKKVKFCAIDDSYLFGD